MADQIDLAAFPQWVQFLAFIIIAGAGYFASWWQNRGTVQKVVDETIKDMLEQQNAKIAQLEEALEEHRRRNNVQDELIKSLRSKTTRVVNGLGVLETRAKSIQIDLQAYLNNAEAAPDAAAQALKRIEVGFNNFHHDLHGLAEDTGANDDGALTA